MVFALVAIIFVLIACILGLFVGVPVYGFTDGEVMRVVFLSVMLLLVINIFFASTIRFIVPMKSINPFSKIYRVYPWEKKVYVALGIRKWKDKIPELGKTLENFDKSSLSDPHNNEYVLRFIRMTIKAEIMHKLSAWFGLLIIFVNLKLFLVVGLPLIICNFIINIMPVMVQRYNRPKLLLLYKRNERLMAGTDNKEQSI